MIFTKKIQIFPTELQKEYFNKAFGLRRFIWNLCIDKFIENNDIEFDKFKFAKELNSLALTEEYSFFNEVNSMVRQECLSDFELSYRKYKSIQHTLNIKGITDINKGRPTKKELVQAFRYNNKGVKGGTGPVKYLDSNHFWLTTTRKISFSKANLPLFSIETNYNESIEFLNPTEIRFATITIKKDFDNRYYAIFTFERTNHKYTIKDFPCNKVGIDMGIKTPLTCVSENENHEYEYYEYNLPKKINTIQRRIDYENSKITKKIKGSKNYNKHYLKISKLYRKLTNIRKEFVFQTVNQLCTVYHTIIIEDFVYNYRKAGLKCNKTMSNIGKYRFTEHLRYKSEMYGNELIFVKKGFPSTQTCSMCGHRFTGNEKLTLKDRVYKCPNCGMELNRDINAAINIYNYLELKNYIT